MKSWKINSRLSIHGDTLEQAIGNNFERIARMLRIGNVAGYRLERVWCEYDDAEQTAVLHIVASGSDVLVNYDPVKDLTKETVVRIPAAPEDCPARIDFELKPDVEIPFDPFDDAMLPTPAARLGALLGIINEVGRKHCKIREDDDVADRILIHYPRMEITAPRKFVEVCRRELTRRRPKTDDETARLMDRISDLALQVLDEPRGEALSAYWIYRSKTAKYFADHNKVTALAKLRKERGMTQAQLAEAAQMSVRQLQNYERCPGSTLWSASKYVPERLALALHVDRSKIVDKDGFALLVDA